MNGGAWDRCLMTLWYQEMQIDTSAMPVFSFVFQMTLKLCLLDFCEPHYDCVSEANRAVA